MIAIKPQIIKMIESHNFFTYIYNLLILYLIHFVFISTDFFLGILLYPQIASKIKNGR